MKITHTMTALTVCLLVQSAVAADKPKSKIDVAGRTYCSVLNIQAHLVVEGQERVRNAIARRKVTFLEGGMWTTEPVSWVGNIHLSGSVIMFNVPIAAATFPYAQTGNKLLMGFGDGAQATWYVSGDGSVINGSWIRHLPDTPGVGDTTGETISWTLVEGDDCNPELNEFSPA